MLEPVFAWVEGTRVAQAIAQSVILTGMLSGAHLIGLTLVLGGALASSLRGFGVLCPERPVAEVASAMVSAISVGLGISVITGVLLVAPRLSDAAANGTFRIKMLVLVAAATVHLTTHRQSRAADGHSPGRGRRSGAVGLSLWLAVALAGCAYILLE